MSLRRLAVASFLVTAACAGPQKTDGSQATTVQERMRITNQPAFDVATCQSRPLTLPPPANQGLLVGALVSIRPQVMECLVDPKSRAGGATTKVTVKTSVTAAAATHSVSGDNLTPEGQKCVQDAVNALVPIQPLAQGAQPVESQTEFIHEKANSPSVTFGTNEGSDFSGTVRLAQAKWCECYAPYTTQAPPSLSAKLTLRKTASTPAEVTFEPSGSTEGDQLAACLKEKIAALPAKLSSDELSFPYRFVHFHSLATQPAANLAPELLFYQLELVRNQSAGAAAIAYGNRDNAADVYDALVKEYQKDPKKNFGLVPQLREKCATLVQTSDAWIASLEAQQSVEQQTVALVQQLKAKDAAWSEVETASQGSLDTTQKDLAGARARRQADADACPKERK
ncbi:hypothetical protein [Hyalangium rubrum]|uniref:Lipoprotein n=1 Tax=Hyalangium rubrum TaxID=3103134 RepID=A0ABU5HAG9_9BACT|nr:hypothetical protein [Hyalangium sp. s54d21]MDY7229782.1 hypothetical protein [Hyalangium sp. s54d21]